MPMIQYRDRAFRGPSLSLIREARAICESYARQGYSLTLRQLFYQLVSHDVIPNKQTEYKRLGSIVDDARYAGLIDWNHVVDRTRNLREQPAWGNPEEDAVANAKTFVEAVMPQFRISKWDTQPTRIEVWIEKDALIDVIARPANTLQLPHFACRGYNSTSNAWRAAKRIESYYDGGAERVVILHLGDHDPEGIDMSRDIEKRFRTFMHGDGYEQAGELVNYYDGDGEQFEPHVDEQGRATFEVRRIALNMDQIRQYNPPPNTAKESSSRYDGYVRQFGIRTSWELDALDPPTINALITGEVMGERNTDLWDEAQANEDEAKEQLEQAADRWSDVVEFLNKETD